MKKLNSLILNSTVNFLDFIYSGRNLQRFWVLEVIARSPYFAFLSVLHFKESLGLKNEKTMILIIGISFYKLPRKKGYVSLMISLGLISSSVMLSILLIDFSALI